MEVVNVLQSLNEVCNHVYIARRSFSIASALLCLFRILSPDILAQPKNLTFEHFSLEVTSPLWVPCIYQDRTGYLWFGTVNGADRYDGHSFTSFSHQPGDSAVAAWVQTLFEDRAGNMWLGTSHGLDKVDSVTGRLRHYTPNPQKPTHSEANWVYAIHEDHDGTLLVGTRGGLHLLNPTTEAFTSLFHDSTDPGSISSNAVNAIHEDATGSMWIGTGGGLDRFDRATGKFIHYWRDANSQRDDGSNTMNWISNIYEDHSGVLWLGTNGGLVAFDQKAERFTPYTHDPKNPGSLVDNNVTSICEDESGTLWVGTGGAGLDAFDRWLKRFSHYVHDANDPASLSNNSIAFVYRERSGTLWIGTNGGGVNKLNRTKPLFTLYTHEDRNPKSLLHDNIRSVVEGNAGTVLVVTAKGLERFDPRSETFTHLLRDESVQEVVEDRKGTLWVGTWHGLYTYDGHGRLIGLRDSSGREFHENVTCICEGRDRKFWIGTWGGELFLLDATTNAVTSAYKSNSLMMNTVFEDAHGVVWAGMWDGGLICYDPSTGSTTQYVSEWGKPAVLSSNHIMSIHEGRTGMLWFGANNGLNKYDRATGTFTHLIGGERPGGITSILEDDRGNLWMGSTPGISKYDPETMRFSIYDGTHRDWERGCRVRNGEMYFGGSKGLIRFHPDSIRDNSFVPPIVITSFRKFEKPFPFGNEIRLTYGENFVSFEFAALSYVSPEKNQYAYKMEGLDKDWVYSGTRHYAAYPHLEPGEYIFRVKGSNNDGAWNEEGTSIAVIITPPWWKRWWFTTFLWLTIVGSIGGGIRYIEMKKLKKKIQQLEQEHAIAQERDRTRDRIASDLHDDVASTLGSIALYTESLNRGLKSTSQPTRDLVQRINTLLNEAQDAVSDIVWSVTPRHDTLEDLLWRMKDLAADLCSANGIAYSIDIPKNLDVVDLPEKLRKNIYLIFKEAINNIIKHAQAKSVSMRVEIVSAMFEMVIEDDGVGFVKDGQSAGASLAPDGDDYPVRGHGMRNMTKRAEEIGGLLSVRSTPGKGTTLRLSVSMT
jgi:ligand-binding sensor domain-containing protein/signal transduction histidine kinase